ncbi:MAG: YmdB family metallophosphoesterase, partial [Promethearchaeota archaeon]
YVTDIGMTGPVDSIIGDDVEAVLERFLTMIPNRLPVGKGKTTFNAVVVTVDDINGKASDIERISREVD